MRRHAPFEPIDPNICMWGGVHDVINPAIFLKIDPRVSELADPEIWHFRLTLLVVLTTLSLYHVRCDNKGLVILTQKIAVTVMLLAVPIIFN